MAMRREAANCKNRRKMLKALLLASLISTSMDDMIITESDK